MFADVALSPPDPILGLSEAFRSDPDPRKINLAVGVYKDEAGQTPVLAAVKDAERRLVEQETTKGYLSIEGSAAYGRAVRGLLFGGAAEFGPLLDDAEDGGRAWTAHTPGGTGALRVAADYLKENHPDATVHLSDPTWANHAGIFHAAGLATQTYRYFDPDANALDFAGMRGALEQMSAGDVVLLHGCCHNPTGVDPSAPQWGEIAAVVAERGVLPLIDFAYQGFGEGLEEDAAGLRAVAQRCPELLVCSSFSKNFGLYRDRVGALTVVAGQPAQARAVGSQVRTAIRRNYSNPPAHGGEVVRVILGDEALTQQWREELTEMRRRINGMRQAFAQGLDQRGVSLSPRGNGFIGQQNGMFTLSGLTPEQVKQLRDQHSIYIVGSGRINVAGMTRDNLPVLCDAVQQVVAG